jgi:hypothetical protein
MQFRNLLSKVAASLAVTLFAVAVTIGSAMAASEFEGTWKVLDSQGKPFQIVLSADGTAKGDRSGEGLNGTWKADGDSAVITWDTEWTTTITKEGAGYKKTATKKGEAAGAASDAEKVQ